MLCLTDGHNRLVLVLVVTAVCVNTARVEAGNARFTRTPHEVEDDGVDHDNDGAERITHNMEENTTHVQLGG